MQTVPQEAIPGYPETAPFTDRGRARRVPPGNASLCRKAGVAAVLVRETKGAPVGGAAKWLSPCKAMIGLTLRGGRDDRFWFSYFHEAEHLLHDSKKEIDIDAVEDPREQRANQFAANFLIPPALAGELAGLTTEAQVIAVARELGIAPGIIVGRLQHDGTIPYSRWNGLKKELKWRVKHESG